MPMLPTLLFAAILLQAPSAAPPVQPESLPHEGVWVVEMIDHIRVLPESQVTMRLERQNVSGHASCNTYRGQLTVSGTDVKVGELLRTMMACDQATMSQEKDFFSVLGAAVTYELRGTDTMVLSTSAGRTITARRK
jgi:heat shock protein HslJ